MTTTAAASVRELPPRQLALLILLETLWANTGTPPSVRELADAYEVRSLNSVVQQLRALREKGFVLLRGAGGARSERSVLRVLRPQTWAWYRVFVRLRPRGADGPTAETTRDLPAPDATWALAWTAADLVKDEQWMRSHEVISLTQDRISPPDEPPAELAPSVAELSEPEAVALAAVIAGEGLPQGAVQEYAGSSAAVPRLVSAGLLAPSREHDRLVATAKGLDGHRRARGRLDVKTVALALDRAGGPLAEAMESGETELGAEWGLVTSTDEWTWLQFAVSDGPATPARVLRRILAEVDEYPYHANLLASLTGPVEPWHAVPGIPERAALRLLELTERWGLARTRGAPDNAMVAVTELGRVLLDATDEQLEDVYADLHEWADKR